MSEDMTYAPVQTVAQLQERVRELERENAELRAELQQARVALLTHTVAPDPQYIAVAKKRVEAMQQPRVDWETAPEWAKWHAIDSTGVCKWFSGRPQMVAFKDGEGGWLNAINDRAERYRRAHLNGIDWTQTLRQRPQEVQP